MPLNKTALNETVSARRDIRESDFATPSKREADKYSLNKNAYENLSGPGIFSSEKLREIDEGYRSLTLGNRRETNAIPPPF